MEAVTLYERLTMAGVLCDNHESDLYCRVTAVSGPIVRGSGLTFSTFIDQRDGALMYDIPFAFDPWWQARIGRRAP